MCAMLRRCPRRHTQRQSRVSSPYTSSATPPGRSCSGTCCLRCARAIQPTGFDMLCKHCAAYPTHLLQPQDDGTSCRSAMTCCDRKCANTPCRMRPGGQARTWGPEIARRPQHRDGPVRAQLAWAGLPVRPLLYAMCVQLGRFFVTIISSAAQGPMLRHTCLSSVLCSMLTLKPWWRRLLSQLMFAAKGQGRPMRMLTSDTEFYSLTRQVLAVSSQVPRRLPVYGICESTYWLRFAWSSHCLCAARYAWCYTPVTVGATHCGVRGRSNWTLSRMCCWHHPCTSIYRSTPAADVRSTLHCWRCRSVVS